MIKTMHRILNTLVILCVLASAGMAQSITDVADLIRQGRMEEARSFIHNLDRNAEDPEAVLFLRGMVASNGESAVDFYNQLLRDFAGSRFADDALLRLAQIKYAQGLYRSSNNHFLRLIREFPRSPHQQTVHYWVGLCYLNTDQADSASVYLRYTIDDFSRTDLTDLSGEELRNLEKQTTSDDEETAEPSLRYAVQVGAFANQTNALLRKSYFEQRGHHVDLRTKVREGQTLYLVWVGSFGSREDAYRFGEELKRKYGVRYTLVSE